MATDVDAVIREHKGSITAALRTLQRRLRDFSRAIHSSSSEGEGRLRLRPVVVFEPRLNSGVIVGFKELKARASQIAAADAFSQIAYRRHDRANESIKCHGVLGAPRDLIRQAQSVNRAKAELREAFRPIAGRSVRIPGKDATGKQRILTRELTTVVLRHIQSSDLNLLAAYREVPIVTDEVDKIRFMLTRTRSVPRRTVGALIEQLEATERGTVADKDLRTLKALAAESADASREYLVSPKPYYYRMRAQVSVRHVQADRRQRRIVSADLPILVPMGASTVDPNVTGPSPASSDHSRRESKISDDEVVKSLGFFRMKPAYRQYADEVK